MTSTLVLVEYTKKRFYMACVSGDKIAYAKKTVGSFKMVDGTYEQFIKITSKLLSWSPLRTALGKNL